MGKGPKVNQGVVDTQANLASGLAGNALPAIGASTNYWTSLLKGGNAAQQAVAPFAESVGQVYGGAENSIRNLLPMGGERNLALATIPIQRAGDIARLYAGVGPQAAGALGQLGLGSAGAGVGAGGTLTNLAGQQAAAKGQAIGGIGQGLGSAIGGFAGRKGGGGGKGGGSN